MTKELERCELCDHYVATLICNECNTIFCDKCVEHTGGEYCPECLPPKLDPYKAEEIEP